MKEVSKKLRLEMLERELHGVEVELEIHRSNHVVETAAIERLEAEHAYLAARIGRLRNPQNYQD